MSDENTSSVLPAPSATPEKAAAIDSLETALREIESGQPLTVLEGGHGIQSRTFEFSWKTPTLEIDLAMPYARVLASEETQLDDDAAIGAACRLAILLIEADAAGTLLAEGESSMTVTFDRHDGAAYRTTDPDGLLVDSASDWAPLAARLEAIFQTDASDALNIIWP